MINGELFEEHWPPSYTSIFLKRQEKLIRVAKDPAFIPGAVEYYSTRPVEFIEDWCITYDPRNATTDLPTIMPFILFPRQKEFINFLQDCIDNKLSGLCEKCRDMGVTWLACAFSVWLWRFKTGSSVGWGSRKEMLVDRLGDPDSIFEKIRMTIDYLPRWLWPAGFDIREHTNFMKIRNPENGATITGEAGDEIGRGGRKSIYFKDESAHYERPERIEGALGENTDVPIDMSSVNGTSNIFHRRRVTGVLWPGDKKKHRFLSLIGVTIRQRIKRGTTRSGRNTSRKDSLTSSLKKLTGIIAPLSKVWSYLKSGYKRRLMLTLNLIFPLRVELTPPLT